MSINLYPAQFGHEHLRNIHSWPNGKTLARYSLPAPDLSIEANELQDSPHACERRRAQSLCPDAMTRRRVNERDH